jgi:NADH dehydrogenase
LKKRDVSGCWAGDSIPPDENIDLSPPAFAQLGKMQSMNKVLVLGGTGFIGSHVCEKLVRLGWRVTVPTRRRDNARHLLHLPLLTVLETDVHDEAALAAVAAGHQAVVNLVAILHGSERAFEQVHVSLPQKLARACRSAHIRQVIHVSALGADSLQPDSAPSRYLRSKSRGEAVLAQASNQGEHFNLTLLRPSVVFGAGDKFLNVFARLQKVFPWVPLACADARFQPVWVEDLASAVARCLQPGMGKTAPRSPRILEICGPEIFSLRQLVALAGQLAGVNGGLGRPVMGLPLWLGRVQAAMMSLMPGEPLMSQDNLDSMRMPNVASGRLPGLESLGITASALRPVASDYLGRDLPGRGLQGLRARAHDPEA